MSINNKSAVIGLLILCVLAAFLSIKHAKSPSDSPSFQAIPPASKRSLRPDTRESRSAREDDKDLILVIRAHLELLLSETPDLASLDEVLAACRRLKSTSSILELLSDPRFGWKRMSPSTLFDNSNSRTFVPFAYKVHETLFERWGELDLDGALKTLRNMHVAKRGGDFDEGMRITFNLYKGAASAGDGKHVFDTLIPPTSNGFSEHDSCALGYLIEGWARSDPDAAWQTLVSFPAMQNAGNRAIKGYFNGLPADMDWTAMTQKVEEYCAAGQFIAGRNARGEFLRDLAVSWIRHDPAAALAWFGSNCDDPLPNRDPAANPRVASHTAVINEWLMTDLQGATQWLATWESNTVSVPEVLVMINEWHAHSNNPRPDIREAVAGLLRDVNN